MFLLDAQMYWKKIRQMSFKGFRSSIACLMIVNATICANQRREADLSRCHGSPTMIIVIITTKWHN